MDRFRHTSSRESFGKKSKTKKFHKSMKIIIEARCCPAILRKCDKHIKFYVARPVNMALNSFYWFLQGKKWVIHLINIMKDTKISK